MTRPTAILAILLGLLAGSGPASAQDTPAEEPFKLRVTGSTVNIRSHADGNSRVVLTVPEDSVLTALALEGDWYRILPPEGVFSYVSADYIDRIAGSNRGRVQVATGTLRVRVGSAVVKLNPTRSAVQKRLEDDTEVEILGEEDGWYQIVPPEGVYFYVSANHTKPVEGAAAAKLEAEAARRDPAPSPISRPVVRDVRPSPVANTNDPLPAPRAPVIEGEAFSDAPVPEREPVARIREEPIVVRRQDSPPVSPTTVKPGTSTDIVRAGEQTPTTTTDAGTHTRTNPFGRPIPATTPQTPPPVALNPPAVAGNTPTLVSSVTSPPVTMPQQPVPAQPVVPQRPMPLPRFVAEGVLQPNFTLPMGSDGLRYELQHPYSRKVIAYAEFGASVQANPTSLVGHYVGIVGPQFTEPKSGQQIVRVTGVTALPRPQGVTPRPQGVAPRPRGQRP